MTTHEKQFKNICNKMEQTVIKNRECRQEKGIPSCYCCSEWNECRANDWDDLLRKKIDLEQYVKNSWEIELEIRKNYGR